MLAFALERYVTVYWTSESRVHTNTSISIPKPLMLPEMRKPYYKKKEYRYGRVKLSLYATESSP